MGPVERRVERGGGGRRVQRGGARAGEAFRGETSAGVQRVQARTLITRDCAGSESASGPGRGREEEGRGEMGFESGAT